MCDENGNIKMKKNDLEKIMEVVNTLSQGNIQVVKLETNYENLKERIDEEIKERKEDTGEIKDNYIDRFNRVEKTLGIIFDKIKDTNKMLIGLFIFLLTSFMGATVFMILNKIWNWF